MLSQVEQVIAERATLPSQVAKQCTEKDVVVDTIICGNALDVLRTLPDECVQMCITSPPYYRQRDYTVCGQIGNEPTVQEYVDTLVWVFREVRRVLHKSGTCWVVIGDTFYPHHGSRGNKRGCAPDHKYPNAITHVHHMQAQQGYQAKDLLLVPARVALALQADGWVLRQDVIWEKPNAKPESVRDRPTTSHEHVLLFAKSERYYYDTQAIAEPVSRPDERNISSKKTRNRRSVWSIPTTQYKEAHFATFPEALVELPVRAGSRHEDIILDPFCGAGTVPLVALKEGRHFLGIELRSDYISLSTQRIAPYLTHKEESV